MAPHRLTRGLKLKTEEIIRRRFLAEPIPKAGVSRFNKILAFIMRDFKAWQTYKLWVLVDIMSSLGFVATYFFVSKIISPQALTNSGYGTDFLTFAVIGISFKQYVNSSISGLSDSIRHEQLYGTMEVILSSRTGFKVFLLGESVFRFMLGSYFLLASLVLGEIAGSKITLNLVSALSATLLTALLVISHMVVGILCAGAILRVKQGMPIFWAFSWLTQLFSGVLYPLGLLPNYLQWIGEAFPLTYSLDGLRRCLINGEDLTSPIIFEDVVKLTLFIAVVLPLSLYIFKKMYDSTRREGTLGQY